MNGYSIEIIPSDQRENPLMAGIDQWKKESMPCSRLQFEEVTQLPIESSKMIDSIVQEDTIKHVFSNYFV